jgi:SAM-dependent methyltransferase
MPSQIKQAQRFYETYHARFPVLEDSPQVLKDLENNRRFLRENGIPSGASLLDLSCGQGLFLKAAFEGGLRVTGLDLSRTAVARARARVPGAKVVVGNAEKLPFKKSSFDWVTCWGSLEHYANPEKALDEIRRVLKPGGRAVLYVPNLFFLGYIYLAWRTGETPHEAGQDQFERLQTRQGWEDMFKRHGFRVESVGKNNDMSGTGRVPRWMTWAYGLLVEPFVPLNLSYCLLYVVSREPRSF